MCAPVAIAMLAGTAVSMYAQHRKGQFDSQVAENNAEMARQQSNDVIQQGAYQARSIENEGRRVGASARVAAEANGATGQSVDNMVAASSANAAVDAATVKSNAVRTAWGFRAEENQQRANAKDARTAGLLGALGTGLSGLGQAGSAYADTKNKGA